MPGVGINIKLTEKQDKRIKLLTEDKEEIKRLYATKKYSLRELGLMYKVNKKTILLIVNPETKRKNDERIKNNWKKYYDKDKHRENARRYRKHKADLYYTGQLDENALGLKKFNK